MRLTTTDSSTHLLEPAARPIQSWLVSVPSRHNNPFATCWTRPGAIPYRFFDGQSADELVAKLATHEWRGEILGPHGSGKSTLLATLTPRIKATGRRVVEIALRDGQRRLPRGFIIWEDEAPAEPVAYGSAGTSPSCHRPRLLIIDGYEQLGWLERLRVKRHCRRSGDGLLITSHAPTGLPTLVDLKPSLAHVLELTSVLCAHSGSPISWEDVAATYARCGSNVREIFFELYDRHETLRRRV